MHRELIFDRLDPFGGFNPTLNRKWFMVQDCFYCKRHRYTLVYFNQRSPNDNNLKPLEGQEELIRKIEEQAALAEGREQQSARSPRSGSVGTERNDPMIIANGELHQMVDPIVFAGQLCL